MKSAIAAPLLSGTPPIGVIVQVNPSHIEVGFFGAADSSGGEFGDMVVISAREQLILAQVTEIRMQEHCEVSIDGSPRIVTRVGAIRPLCTLDEKEQRVKVGIDRYPRIQDLVYLAPDSALSLLASDSAARAGDVTLEVGKLGSVDGPLISLPPERLFSTHAAVIGTTGAGKSWSVARLVEECARYRAKIILFDPSGEFGALNRSTVHVHLGRSGAHERSVQVSVPYYHLTESDLFAIFRPSGPSQGPMLRAAISSLKLARLAPQIAPAGTIHKAHRSKKQFMVEHENFLEEIESPWANFEIQHLAAQIENECVNPQASPTEPMVWGGVNPVDQANCMPLISRVNDVIHNPGLAPIFNPGGSKSLIEVFDAFIDAPEARVLCVSLKNLSFASNAREVILNALGRRLYDLARAERFVGRPTLLILDEAHQFLNTTLDKDESFRMYNAFALIAKEGRKYGLTMCLATQRPRDIPEGVLSQMGTIIIHRLINDHDLKIVERASGELDRFTSARIPVLAPGEAIIVGVHFPVPLHIRVSAPECRPTFKGADYQSCWRKQPV